jgi:ABC-type antimicrobial peptide transport system permease subunit
MWMLKIGLGNTFKVPDKENREITLKIVATLKDSVFQSQVLIPNDAFRRHFPKTEGFGFFLLDVPPGKADAVSRVLTDGLASYGFETTPTKERVAEYLAVQNTYLTTFQLLGGFGLLLGVLGLAVVLLRSIWERRAELALMRALGYRKRALNGIILAENGLLLVLGLGAGIAAALAAVAPHLASGGQVPWARLGIMLGLVFVVGLSVAYFAVITTLRAPLIPALREE